MDNSFESKALWLHDNGYSCAESILRAAEDAYGLEENKEMAHMCAMLSNGMGVGCFCGAILVGILLLGRMFDPDTAKRLRIRLLWEFREEFCDFNCQAIKGTDGCDDTISEICHIIDEFILNECCTVKKPI